MGRPSLSEDLIGQVFTRLTVLRRTKLNGRTAWECICVCGNKSVVRHSALKSGNTKSCGCLDRDAVVTRNKAASTHGHSRGRDGRPTKTFTAWVNMIQRCENTDHTSYAIYGGRGIEVCDRWRQSFENFLADMGEAPKGLSIDRIDGDKGYEPGNCRWATQKEQTNNLRTNRKVTLNGLTMNLKEWARKLGISHQCLRYRISAGWTDDQITSTPVNHGNHWKLQRK